MTKLTEDQQSQALDQLLATCPLVGIWASSGTGKTTFWSQIMHPGNERYRKVLFIDADAGSATISHLTSQPELCIHRRPKKAVNALQLYHWVATEIGKADKHEGVGAVVIEGLAKIYETMSAENMLELDPSQCKGYKLQQCYIGPSMLTGALCEAAGFLRERLLASGRSAPVVVSCNTKEKRNDEEGTAWDIPALSPSVAQKLRGRCDAFVQLSRSSASSGIKILTDRDRQVTDRKLRHEGAAKAIAQLKNPGLADMFQSWANATAVDSAAVAQHLSQTN